MDRRRGPIQETARNKLQVIFPLGVRLNPVVFSSMVLCGSRLGCRMCPRCALQVLIQVAFPVFFLVPGWVGSSVPTYERTDKVTGTKITCNKCPPGTYVANHCTIRSATECQPCPDQHYTQYWNYLEECRFCNVFCEGQGTVKHECNATHNRVCECPSGYYRTTQMCMKHTKCRSGYGVSRKGTPERDTQCVRCAAGTFSSAISATHTCQPHLNCTEIGQIVNVPGTAKHDTLCTKCMDPDNTESEDCNEAVLDYVVYNILYKRSLRHYRKFLRTRVLWMRRAMKQKNLRAYLKHLQISEYQNLLKTLYRGELQQAMIHPLSVGHRTLP